MSDKKRADILMVEQGLAPSREKAQASIMAGTVYAGEKRINKASEMLSPEEQLTLRGTAHPFVGRGGLKLQKAITSFGADLTGRVCMDMFMADVTDLPEVLPGDECVIFGRQGEEYLPVEEQAARAHTINYEILCAVSKRVPRKYV